MYCNRFTRIYLFQVAVSLKKADRVLDPVKPLETIAECNSWNSNMCSDDLFI